MPEITVNSTDGAKSDTLEGCATCGDTLTETHHVMCQACGRMNECSPELPRSIFGGFLCATCTD